MKLILFSVKFVKSLEYDSSGLLNIEEKFLRCEIQIQSAW